MRTIIKLVIGIVVLLALVFLVLLVPLPEAPPMELDEGVLLQIQPGGEGVIYHVIRFYDSGRIEVTNGRTYTDQMSDKELSDLKEYILGKKYALRKSPLISRYIGPSIRPDVILISQQGRTVQIQGDRLISELSSRVMTEAIQSTGDKN